MTYPERKIRYRFLKTLSINLPIPLINGAWCPLRVEFKGDLVLGNPGLWETKIRVYKQRMINNFIVDFYIPAYKLVIEIDWESHFTESAIEYDKERTSILEWMWLEIIRFTNKQIIKEFDWVCEEIIKKIKNINNYQTIK